MIDNKQGENQDQETDLVMAGVIHSETDQISITKIEGIEIESERMYMIY